MTVHLVSAVYLGVLQSSADALSVLEQLAHLGQEPAPQRHQLLDLLLVQAHGFLHQSMTSLHI